MIQIQRIPLISPRSQSKSISRSPSGSDSGTAKSRSGSRSGSGSAKGSPASRRNGSASGSASGGGRSEFFHLLTSSQEVCAFVQTVTVDDIGHFKTAYHRSGKKSSSGGSDSGTGGSGGRQESGSGGKYLLFSHIHFSFWTLLGTDIC